MGFSLRKSLSRFFLSTQTETSVRVDPKTRDEDLMLAYKNGSMPAFETLLVRHEKPLYHFLLRLLKNPEVAEEAFQEVFLRVIRVRDEYEPTAKFTTWLYTLARNYALDILRRKRFDNHEPWDADQTPLDAASPLRYTSEILGTEATAHSRELQKNVSKLLDELNPDQRQVFLLREINNLSFDEIAVVTGTSANTAKSRMRYALEFLQKRLGELGIGAEK